MSGLPIAKFIIMIPWTGPQISICGDVLQKNRLLLHIFPINQSPLNGKIIGGEHSFFPCQSQDVRPPDRFEDQSVSLPGE